jgi:hypothetical protein
VSNDPDPAPLSYERRRPRRKRPVFRELVAFLFGMSLAVLWPLWAVYVVIRLASNASTPGPMPPFDVGLIVATFLLPLSFAFVVDRTANDRTTRRR